MRGCLRYWWRYGLRRASLVQELHKTLISLSCLLFRSFPLSSLCHVKMNPRFSVHTADKTSPRGFNWIWFLRLAEIVVSLIVLSLAARDIAGLSSLGCNVPGKMAWNMACVCHLCCYQTRLTL